MYTWYSSILGPFLPSDGANITIVPDHESVQVGENVTLTCNATAERKIKALKWIDDANHEIRPKDGGVTGLPPPTFDKSNTTVSSMLTLSVVDKNGVNWPKTVRCQVVLVPEEGKSSSEMYEATHQVEVAGTSLMV